MGCFGSKSSGGGDATENGGEREKVKRQRSKTSNNAVSAVLLGLQGSGKSTIRKQLQVWNTIKSVKSGICNCSVSL